VGGGSGGKEGEVAVVPDHRLGEICRDLKEKPALLDTDGEPKRRWGKPRLGRKEIVTDNGENRNEPHMDGQPDAGRGQDQGVCASQRKGNRHTRRKGKGERLGEEAIGGTQ